MTTPTAPTTLFDFYQGQGQALPTLQARGVAFEKAGLGSAGSYQGTADQNTKLLATLTNPKGAAPASAAAPNMNIQTSTPASAQPAASFGTPAPAPAAAPAAASTPAAAPASATASAGYTGPSVVDYLASVGRPADFGSRAALATSMGIQNYTGTAAQNTQMLGLLRSATPQAPAAASGSGAPADTTAGGGTANADNTAATDKSDPYAGLDPVTRQVKEYQDAATQMGLPTIKDQMEGYQKQLDDVNNELADKVLNVNNNPWLSEGLRTKEISKLQDSYKSRTDALTHLLTLTSSLFTQGQAQVDKIVSGADADRKQINDSAQKALDAATALAKDNEVRSVGGRELLINKATGKTVADLGPSTKSGIGSAGTAAERASAAESKFQNAFVAGAKLPSGVPVLDSEGFLTPEAFKAAAADAPSQGLSRAQFLQAFGHLLVGADGTVSPKFGLTPAEAKLVGATVRT